MKVKYYKALPDEKTGIKRTVLVFGLTIAACIYQPIIIALHSLFHQKRNNYRYHTALCMIFKNEGKFLKEWIEYHLLIGVEHFFLYNNNSDDDYLSVLAPYIEQGVVTLTDWPQLHSQLSAYRDCYQRHHKDIHWLGYIDADEFVNLQSDNSLKDMLARFRRYPALQLQWRDFGTNGYIKKPEGLLTENFTAAWPWLCHVGKTFINNDFDFKEISLHTHKARCLGFTLYPVNDIKLPVPHISWLWKFNIGKRGYINHYFSRWYEWYVYKDHVRGDALASENVRHRKAVGRFELHELNNYSHDYSIQRWLTLLKLKMGID